MFTSHEGTRGEKVRQGRACVYSSVQSMLLLLCSLVFMLNRCLEKLAVTCYYSCLLGGTERCWKSLVTPPYKAFCAMLCIKSN
jgi:hypothetical protein